MHKSIISLDRQTPFHDIHVVNEKTSDILLDLLRKSIRYRGFLLRIHIHFCVECRYLGILSMSLFAIWRKVQALARPLVYWYTNDSALDLNIYFGCCSTFLPICSVFTGG